MIGRLVARAPAHKLGLGPVETWKQPGQRARLRRIVNLDIGIGGMHRGEVLMIILRRIEGLCVINAGYDRRETVMPVA